MGRQKVRTLRRILHTLSNEVKITCQLKSPNPLTFVIIKSLFSGNITSLTKDISKPIGGLWLITVTLFVTAIVLFLRGNDKWWIAGIIAGIIAAILSQALIFTVWQDAKFGTIANIIILIPAFFNTFERL